MNSFAFLTFMAMLVFFFSSNEAFQCVDNTGDIDVDNDDGDGPNMFMSKIVAHKRSARFSPLSRLMKRAIGDDSEEGKCQADDGAYCINASCVVDEERQTVQFCTGPMPKRVSGDDICEKIINLCEDEFGGNGDCTACNEDNCNE